MPMLAIVGGGPSVANYIDTLRNWRGAVWAINGAWRWCRDNGIEATFISIDPAPAVADLAEGAKRAILADICDPATFDAVDGPVEVFRIGSAPCGSTTACTVPMIAALCGAPGVTMFGVESSFDDRMHVYSWGVEGPNRLWVECGGEEYLTSPQLVMQAEYLAEVITGTGGYVRVEGDGFLPALVRHGDYEVTAVTRSLMDDIRAAKPSRLQHGNQQL